MSLSMCATSVINEELVPYASAVVFDWDNTLKLYDKTTRQISLRVPRETLSNLKHVKKCDMYIISAIRPSRINLETLLTEVQRLGVLDLFANDVDAIDVKSGQYARKGKVVICGYDKAETFLEISANTQTNRLGMAPTVDPASYNDVDGGLVAKQQRPIVFFDDEEVNITNFSSIVKGSKCYWVK